MLGGQAWMITSASARISWCSHTESVGKYLHHQFKISCYITHTHTHTPAHTNTRTQAPCLPKEVKGLMLIAYLPFWKIHPHFFSTVGQISYNFSKAFPCMLLVWGDGSPMLFTWDYMISFAGMGWMAGMKWEEEVGCVKENLTPLTHRSQREPFEQSWILSHDSSFPCH